MEKFIKKITFSYLLAIIMITSFGSAVSAITTDELLPPPADGVTEISGGYKQLNNVRNLPDVSIEGAAATAIKTILGWSMAIALVGIVVAGIYMLAFEGDETKIGKGKNIIQYLIIGEIIISAAYGIVSGLIQFKFF